MASAFNDLELLSQEDLIVETLRNLLKTYHELNRRQEKTKDFLETLCGLSFDSWIWFILWESGGPQRFTDILRNVGGSRSVLGPALQKLLKEGLIRQVDKKYQAVSPAWLVRISEPNRGKF